MIKIILFATVIISREPILHVGETITSKTWIKSLLFLTLSIALAAWFLWELDEDRSFVQCKRSNTQWLNSKIQAEVFKEMSFKIFNKT